MFSDKTTNGKKHKLFTQAYFMKDSYMYSQVLLGYKKRGFAPYKWSGFGGKVGVGETIKEAAVREIKEECGLDVNPHNLHFVGVNLFEFEGKDVVMEVHVFMVDTFTGAARETDDMRPNWFGTNNLPFDVMWPENPPLGSKDA